MWEGFKSLSPQAERSIKMGQLLSDYLNRVGQTGQTPSPKPNMVSSGNEYTGSFLTKLKTFLPAVGWETNKIVTNAVARGVEYFNSVNPAGAKDIPVPTRVKESDKIYVGNKFVDETVTPLAGELILWAGAEALTFGAATPALAALRGTAAVTRLTSVATKIPKITKAVQEVYSLSSRYKTATKLITSAAKQGIVGAEIGALKSYSEGEDWNRIAKEAFTTGLWAAGGTAAIEGVGLGVRALRTNLKTGVGQAAGALARESDALLFTGRTATDFASATDDITRNAVGEASQLKGYADSLVRQAPERAEEVIKNITKGNVTEAEMHVAGSYIDDLVKQGRSKEAAEMVRSVFSKAGENPITQERLIQIFSKLDDNGIEEAAKAIIKENGGKADDLTQEILKDVQGRLKDIKQMDYGYQRSIATAQMLNKIVEAVPQKASKEMGKKIGSARRLAMLSGTTTTVNNIAGTAVNQLMENAAKVPAVAVDKLLSIVTGKRSIAFAKPGLGVQGILEGTTKGWKEVWGGVRYGADGYLDVTSNTFKSTVGGFLEKLVQTGLHVPDRAFYISKYAKVANELMRLEGSRFITPKIHEVAHFEALRSTLNNNTVIAKSLEAARTFLNKKLPGSGDVLMPFIKVPVNLAKTALVDFTPLGLFKVMGEALKPMAGKAFNQREFSLALGKAMVGTAGIGTTYFLGKLGLMTGGHGAYDSTLTPIENQQGMGANRINFSALKRFFMTGFSDPSVIEPIEGDKIISYDWLQPLGMTLSIGASAGETAKTQLEAGQSLSLIGGIQAAASGAMGSFNEDTIFGQMVKNISILWEAPTEEGRSDAMYKIQQIVTGIPASFVPNFLNQLRKIEDNNRRKTFDKNWATNAINLMKNKIPGLSRTLDKNYTAFGEVMTYFPEDTNRVLNALLNPALMNTYKLTPELEFLMDVYDMLPPITYRTEEQKKQDELISAIYKAAGKKAPTTPDQPRYDIIPYKWTTIRNPDGKGEKIPLTDDQKIELQKDTTMRVVANINALWGDAGYQKADANKKLEMIKGQVSAAGSDAEKAMQVRVFGYSYSSKGYKKKSYSSPRSYYASRKTFVKKTTTPKKQKNITSTFYK